MLRRRAMMYDKGGFPSGYTQLQYVENKLNYTIVDSGIYPRHYANFKVIAKLSQDSNFTSHVGDNHGYWFGVSQNRWTIGGNVTVGTRTGNIQTFEFTTVRKTTSADVGQMQLKVDGVSSNIRTYNTYNTGTGSFYLVNINEFRGTPIAGKIESFELYGENVLVAKFVPAKRDSDNKVGFYDTVNNTFITPSTGTLIAGPEVN